MKAILGKTSVDPFGALLGTGYHNFQSHCGIGGLAREDSGHLRLLVVHAKHPGHGEFRKFIALAKNNYHTISVWEVWNPDLEQALIRYGFIPCSQTDEQGITNTGMIWHLVPQ